MNGVIDVTNVADSLRSSFVTWATTYLFGLTIAVPGLQWLALPFISSIYKSILNVLVGWLSNAAVMEAFFIATAMRKNSEAQDYIDAVNFKVNMPATASEEEYEKAELKEISAFNSFVILSN